MDKIEKEEGVYGNSNTWLLDERGGVYEDKRNF